jgi:hypothetical protein
MGIHGLHTYASTNIRGDRLALSDDSVVLDGYSFAFWLGDAVRATRDDWREGYGIRGTSSGGGNADTDADAQTDNVQGFYRELASRATEWLASLLGAGVVVLAYFDGLVEPTKKKTKRGRLEREYGAMREAVRCADWARRGFAPLFLVATVIDAAQRLGIETFRAPRDADQCMASLAAQRGCCAVLTMDSDFLILPGPGCVLFDDVKVCDDGQVFVRRRTPKHLARCLGVPLPSLPILACLCRSDFTRLPDVIEDALVMRLPKSRRHPKYLLEPAARFHRSLDEEAIWGGGGGWGVWGGGQGVVVGVGLLVEVMALPLLVAFSARRLPPSLVQLVVATVAVTVTVKLAMTMAAGATVKVPIVSPVYTATLRQSPVPS